MAQPNVVREPSMDEILASIRRIIESNEPVTQASVATPMAEPEGFSGRPANDDTEEVTLTVDHAFSDRDQDYAHSGVTPSALHAMADVETYAGPSVVRDLHQPSPVQPAQAPQKALSLADVAARVRAASERASMVLRDIAPAQAEAMQQPAPVEAQPVMATPAVPEPAPVPEVHSEMREEFVADTRVASVEPDYEEEASYRPEPVSLLSSSVGEQVARSFQDLAIAVDNAERRSFDEIAEDMLRPMLQEWLDDNLPTLVERLVREEIERVARGPRR